jgi:hypothetical protein
LKNELDWNMVWARLGELAACKSLWLSDQDRSLDWIARQLQQQPGVLIADEVGLGKTRLAIALAVCVAACGGRVAFLIPPGLSFQWRDEELGAFLRQVAELDLDWMPRDITSRILRTYPDLFEGGKHPPAYPLSLHSQFLFLSHRFGLPQRLSALTRHALWGLPFALRLILVKDGRRARHAKGLALPAGQTAALDWLAEHLPASLHERVTGTVLSKVSTQAFKDPKACTLFRNLIGELVGDVDLIIVDEAHKSRAGSDQRNGSEQKAATLLQSRLTQCLDEIILRQGSVSRHAKRLALTATPMEMDPEQWGTIFHRLGLGCAEVRRLKTTVKEFAEAVKAVRTGSAKEIKRLSDASSAFQNDLKGIVTRRVWRDHPTIRRFLPYSVQPQAPHPHRRTYRTIVALGELSAAERTRLAFAEGLAAASRGIASHAATKTAGARHAQALPLLPESFAQSTTPDRSAADDTTDGKTAAAEHAKRQRQAYWLAALQKSTHEMGRVTEDPVWSLQWHPKVRHAITLIERLTEQNHKVLVFAEFIAPMRALDRALNIRHYLSQVREDNPVLLPAKLSIDDPDFQRWLRSPELGFSAARIASFNEDAARLAARYSNDRAALREVCQKAVSEFFARLHTGPVTLQTSSMETLVTWLVQQLCTQEQLTVVPTKGNRSHIHEMVMDQLQKLQDADPSGRAEADEADAEKPFDWDAAIKEQEADLEKDQNGRYVFRMSPFSQRLYGDTKPSTRRVRQSAFNNERLHPKVLIGQSAVASEGLNLHHACRSVVLFHLDWNPGRIEQQIGRVDRQGSAWMKAFEAWERAGGQGEVPHIDIHTIALEGTYDAFRTEVVNERAKILRSQLFGEILPAERLQGLSEEARAAVGRLTIDFRP